MKKKGYTIQAAAKGVGEIFIYDDIGDSWDGTTAKGFAKELKALGAVKELRVYINSAGGSVFDGVAIFNQLERHKARVIVNVDGIAASIASVIAMAGDEIAIAANGMIMIHDPWAFALGTAAEMRKMADSLDKVGETILGTYVRRTGGEAEAIKAMMAEETWLTAEEALELGFADQVGAAVAMAAYAGKDLSKFRNAPAQLVEAAEIRMETRINHTLEMSTRVINALAADQIKTIGELVQKTKAELSRMPNIGRLSIHEIETFLASYGLELAKPRIGKVLKAKMSQRLENRNLQRRASPAAVAAQ